MIKGELQDRIPGVRLHTPTDPGLSAGVVVVDPSFADVRQAYDELYSRDAIACAVMSGEFSGIRLCPHIYNTPEEVDRVVEAVAELR